MRPLPLLVLLFFMLVGCGGPSAMVKGTVTCQGKPVAGSILISPKGEGAHNAPALLKDDGTFEIKLTTVGKHTIVVSPRDRKYPVKPGELEFPCAITPIEQEIKAGENTIKIELAEHAK
jgi:hypothetical protein